MRIKEESLDRALEAASLQTKGLPKRYTDGKDPFWIMAVVLVQKRNLEECYCIYQQNADKYMKLLQDFGTPSPIMSIKSIHPYMYLDEAQFLPSGCIEAKKNFLKNELCEDHMAYEVDEMTESDVNHALLEIAIDKQMRADEENKKINVLNEGSDLDGTRFEDMGVPRKKLKSLLTSIMPVTSRKLTMRHTFQRKTAFIRKWNQRTLRKLTNVVLKVSLMHLR